MKTLFWTVVAVIAALFGVEFYRAKKSGKSLGDQVTSDWKTVKEKAAASLKEVVPDETVDETACPACKCQDVLVNTDCPNCGETRKG